MLRVLLPSIAIPKRTAKLVLRPRVLLVSLEIPSRLLTVSEGTPSGISVRWEVASGRFSLSLPLPLLPLQVLLRLIPGSGGIGPFFNFRRFSGKKGIVVNIRTTSACQVGVPGKRYDSVKACRKRWRRPNFQSRPDWAKLRAH